MCTHAFYDSPCILEVVQLNIDLQGSLVFFSKLICPGENELLAWVLIQGAGLALVEAQLPITTGFGGNRITIPGTTFT